MNNKEEQIKVYVMIGTIVMLLVIFSGITYAFFSASNNKGSTSVISATSGKMLISYADGKSDLLVSEDIQPSDAILVNKTFTLTGTNTTSGLAMPYKIGVQYTSTFSDGMMHYYIKEVERQASSNVTANYVITPETGKTENDYKNQTVPGNDTYTGYTHGTFKNGKKYTEMVTGEFPTLKTDQTITFNLIIQFPDNGLNQDSEKGKTFNGKVVVNYEPSFADASWDKIAATVKVNPAAYAVGLTKTLKVYDNSNGEKTNGTYKEYTVRVANNTTPAECNDSNFSQTACGFVVEFVDIVETRQMNSTGTIVGGWKASAMRTYANVDFLNKLPEELRKVIKATKVISGHGNTAGETNFTSTDKIYLLSAHEVWEDGTNNQISSAVTAYDNTRQLDYYKNIGVTTINYSSIIKKYNGSVSNWWLRAARSDTVSSFLVVTNTGDWNVNNADTSYGFAPAFRIG